jgi:ribonuclease HII
MPAPADATPLYAPALAAYRAGYRRIVGIDEAGRGPLAGPVVVAAVALPPVMMVPGLFDSKQLTARQRERAFAALQGNPAIAIAVAVIEVATIDRVNILRATHLGMRQAAAQLAPDFILVDGLPVPDLPCPSQNLVHGDARCASIAAASIVAKVTRDRLMVEADAAYPGYGFARHKGYGTAEHLAALRRLGPCPLHRRSFAPVAAALLPSPVQHELPLATPKPRP